MTWIIVNKGKRKAMGGKYAQIVKGKIRKVTDRTPKTFDQLEMWKQDLEFAKEYDSRKAVKEIKQAIRRLEKEKGW